MTVGADAAREALDDALAGAPYEGTRLASGRVGDILRIDVEGAAPRVAKLDPSGEGGLEVEAEMLRYVASQTKAPVPRVLHASRHVILMEWRPGRTGVREDASESAADALVELHAARGASFGFAAATRIGGLIQLNPEHSSWLEFFAEARLVGPVRAAYDDGRVDSRVVELIERVAARIGDLADEPRAPRLLHGDLWSGNVLSRGAALTAFLDPALHHGHPEVDLAFATMFGGFPRRFFDAYHERGVPPGESTLDNGFWQSRRHLWNLYPLIVHVRLFGGGYVDELVRSARQFV